MNPTNSLKRLCPYLDNSPYALQNANALIGQLQIQVASQSNATRKLCEYYHEVDTRYEHEIKVAYALVDKLQRSDADAKRVMNEYKRDIDERRQEEVQISDDAVKRMVQGAISSMSETMHMRNVARDNTVRDTTMNEMNDYVVDYTTKLTDQKMQTVKKYIHEKYDEFNNRLAHLKDYQSKLMSHEKSFEKSSVASQTNFSTTSCTTVETNTPYDGTKDKLVAAQSSLKSASMEITKKDVEIQTLKNEIQRLNMANTSTIDANDANQVVLTTEYALDTASWFATNPTDFSTSEESLDMHPDIKTANQEM